MARSRLDIKCQGETLPFQFRAGDIDGGGVFYVHVHAHRFWRLYRFLQRIKIIQRFRNIQKKFFYGGIGIGGLVIQGDKRKKLRHHRSFVFRRVFRHDHRRRHKRRERDNRYRDGFSDDKKVKNKTGSRRRGIVFSSGPIMGHNSNIVRGDVISAGPSGLADGIHATSSVYAHTISNSNIDKDAYYTTISGTNVGGVSYPGSPDQATSSLPISDAKIDEWKAEALAGGTYSSPCPYTISGTV